jgi:hypothetical protein
VDRSKNNKARVAVNQAIKLYAKWNEIF